MRFMSKITQINERLEEYQTTNQTLFKEGLKLKTDPSYEGIMSYSMSS